LGTKSDGQTRKARKKCDGCEDIKPANSIGKERQNNAAANATSAHARQDIECEIGRDASELGVLDDVKVRAEYTYQPISSQGLNSC
jgi:hypothetical protein